MDLLYALQAHIIYVMLKFSHEVVILLVLELHFNIFFSERLSSKKRNISKMSDNKDSTYLQLHVISYFFSSASTETAKDWSWRYEGFYEIIVYRCNMIESSYTFHCKLVMSDTMLHYPPLP